jgi:hypothetical protein
MEFNVNLARRVMSVTVVVAMAALVGVWLSSESRAQTLEKAPLTGAWTLNKELSDQPPDRSGGQEGADDEAATAEADAAAEDTTADSAAADSAAAARVAVPRWTRTMRANARRCATSSSSRSPHRSSRPIR